MSWRILESMTKTSESYGNALNFPFSLRHIPRHHLHQLGNDRKSNSARQTLLLGNGYHSGCNDGLASTA